MVALHKQTNYSRNTTNENLTIMTVTVPFYTFIRIFFLLYVFCLFLPPGPGRPVMFLFASVCVFVCLYCSDLQKS